FVLGVLAALIYVLGFAKPSSDKDKGKGDAAPKLVTHTATDTKTFLAAWAQLGDNERLLLQGDIEVAGLTTYRKNNITIEGEARRSITWKAPKGPAKDYLLNVQTVGVKLKNLTFDGQGLTSSVLHLQGNMPEARLENLWAQGGTKYGICFINCLGTE